MQKDYEEENSCCLCVGEKVLENPEMDLKIRFEGFRVTLCCVSPTCRKQLGREGKQKTDMDKSKHSLDFSILV